MAVLYGVKADGEVDDEVDGAAEVAAVLSASLDQPFQERDSMFWGGYWMATIGSSKIKVVSQPQPYRVDEMLEEDFKDYQVLIYVDGPSVLGVNGLVTSYGVIEVLKES